MSGLVLSLFPGIGLLDRAFELEGFCVVRGPDLIWGGDVRSFHPPTGVFDGVIGGPPCQAFSRANGAGRAGKQRLAENLIPEFVRVVKEAEPWWWLMENVPDAPLPTGTGYITGERIVNNRWFGAEQNRERRFTFGGHKSQWLSVGRWVTALEAQFVIFENIDHSNCFTANNTSWDRAKKRSRSDHSRAELARGLRLQGLPEDYLDHCPFTVQGAIHAVGNGVPLDMGRAVARAVKAALASERAA